MFQKDGSSTLNGKKDVPIRKSDRRKLRDRVVDVLFTGGSTKDNNENDAPSGGQCEEWITRAEKLIDDCIVAPKGGDVLARKMKLMGGGEHATLYLRTPSSSSASSSANDSNSNGGELSYIDILKLYPTTWPYQQTTQPILLEYEDSDRKVNLIPLLPLLAALPPSLSSPPLGKKGEEEENPNDDDKNNNKYRIPNIIIHSEVSKYMCRGADLMRSGIRSFPSPWTLRQSKGLVSISIIGNPQPVAVGMIERGLFREYCYPKNGNNRDRGVCSWKDDAVNLVGPGKKGIGVIIVSCYGDDLWKNSLSSKCSSLQTGVVNPLGGGIYDDGNYGNQGFVDGARVHPILDMGEDESDTDDEVEEVDATLEQMSLSENKEESTATASDSATNVKQENEQINEAEQQKDKDSEPDHDEILENAFYKSLLLMLSSKIPLPMPVSTYYAKHLLAAVDPTGHRLDMKQTSYKKIGPFLKDMQSNGVIRLGASKDGKDKCAFLTEIVKNNPDLLQFKRSWKKELEASGGDLSSMKAEPASQKTKLAVVDLFLVPRSVSDGMQLDKDAVMAVNAKTDERKGTGFLTKTECRALIEGYIEKEQLTDPDGKGRVLVNGPLCDAIFRLSKKNKQPGQNVEYPTSVKRKELIEKWLDRMDKGHAIVQMPDSKILHLGRGEPKSVDIEVEFRQGNRRKFLTRLRGSEEYGIDGRMLSQDVSHRFACSSTVETNPVGRPALKKGRVEIVFQGHLSEELTALLTGDENCSHGGAKGSEYCLPKSVINVILRKGVTKKKR